MNDQGLLANLYRSIYFIFNNVINIWYIDYVIIELIGWLQQLKYKMVNTYTYCIAQNSDSVTTLE